MGTYIVLLANLYSSLSITHSHTFIQKFKYSFQLLKDLFSFKMLTLYNITHKQLVNNLCFVFLYNKMCSIWFKRTNSKRSSSQTTFPIRTCGGGAEEAEVLSK